MEEINNNINNLISIFDNQIQEYIKDLENINKSYNNYIYGEYERGIRENNRNIISIYSNKTNNTIFKKKYEILKYKQIIIEIKNKIIKEEDKIQFIINEYEQLP